MAGDFAETFLMGAQMYYIPLLVIIGTLGNCLSVCVFFCTKMRRSSSSFYLAALAISDTGFLASIFVPWLDLFGVGIFNRPGYCQFFIYLSTLCSFLSVWFVVAFTIERFVAVRYPLRRQSMCTVARAKITLICLTAFGGILCSPVLWLSGMRPVNANKFNSSNNSTVCNLAEEWESWWRIFNGADTILTFVLPFTIIVVLNSLIVKSVWRLARVRRNMTTTSTRSSNDEKSLKPQKQQQHSQQQLHQQNSRAQTKITKMLLIVSSVFLCFNLPSYVMRIHVFLKENEEPPRAIVITQHICNLLFDTNFGINFVLYCASGQNFRKAVTRIMLRCTRRWNDAELRVSSRTNQFGSDTTRSSGSMARQRTIVVEMPWEGELSELTRKNNSVKSKCLIDRQTSRDN